MAGPISRSLASSETVRILREDNSALTCVGPIPACSMPRVVNYQINVRQSGSKKTSATKSRNKPAASLVLTSKIGRPRIVPATRFVLFVWQTFISPQSGLQQVMYRKDPNPNTVSSVTLDNCSGLAQTLHP